MIDRRRESRARTALTVRVWGIDANGRAFNDQTFVRDISLRGALLEGLEHPIRPGDLVGVQYGERRARFHVVWVGKIGLGENFRAALQRLQRDDCPWRDELPECQISEARPVELKICRRARTDPLLRPLFESIQQSE